ncbi:MAG: hypothetical protein GY847_08225 [Proteobacteria bacterium]|nr:hypothetical protein [Pseudomonadota bacterium]
MKSSAAEQLTGKRVGICLSAGFFGFYHQAGVLQGICEAGIVPVGLTGTSAGAIVAAMYTAGLSAKDIALSLLSIQRRDFWDLHWPFTRRGFGILAGQRFMATLLRVLKVDRFEDCQVPLTVSAYNPDIKDVQYFSKGPLAPVVYASCALPALFTPGEIDGQRFQDGACGERTPLAPFLDAPDVDTVIVSYISRSRRRQPSSTTERSNNTRQRLIARDQASVQALREAGKSVLVLAPERIWLGPFSLHRAQDAIDMGRTGALELLQSPSQAGFGGPELR